MRNWQETHLVFDEIARLSAAGQRGALAVIFKLEGSAYRLPGAKLLIREDGSMIGNVSGGCLETELKEIGLRVIQGGQPEPVHYDTSGKDDVIWGLGVGCNGKVDILVQPTGAPGIVNVVDTIRSLLNQDDAFAVSAVVSGPHMGRMLVVLHGKKVAGSSGDSATDNEVVAKTALALNEKKQSLFTAGSTQVFTEVLLPPPHLVVIGAGDDSIPLVRLAAQVGFRVTVVDHRPAYLQKDRFPDALRLTNARAEDGLGDIPAGANSLVVVKTHILVQDRGWVELFVRQPVPYIGLLGARARREEILKNVTAEQRKKIYGPVGLDLGAQGPEQVAVSIVAEALAVWSGRSPQHLRDRRQPIHAAR